jgi:hypothetical protein
MFPLGFIYPMMFFIQDLVVGMEGGLGDFTIIFHTTLAGKDTLLTGLLAI